MRYEYKVIPAPKRGEKAKGVKSGEDRFARAIESLMNSQGAEGWDYVRADTLPAEERKGLTGTTTVYHNLLVFRRPLGSDDADDLTVHPLDLPSNDLAPDQPSLSAPVAPHRTDRPEPTFRRARPARGAVASPEAETASQEESDAPKTPLFGSADPESPRNQD